MKRIILYESGTGFTAQYADWIAEELQCESVGFKKAKAINVADYDQVIFGGWMCAGKVMGYDKFKALNAKNPVLFAVGMAPSVPEVAEKIIKDNGFDAERFFYFEGGYRPEKVNFIMRTMMKMLKKSIEKKEEKTEEDLYIIKTFNGADNAKKEAIAPLVEFCMKESEERIC